jgi:predicted GNAT family N-acyltransferase
VFALGCNIQMPIKVIKRQYAFFKTNFQFGLRISLTLHYINLINILSFTSIIYNTEAYWKVLRMRELVLRLPLGLRFSADDIEKEESELIFAFKTDSKIVASCQFVVSGQTAKMRQVATARAFQGQGIGRDLYLYCEENLKKQEITEIYCHARKTAVPFYQKLKFQIVSEEFEEVGIPHVKMKKIIM